MRISKRDVLVVIIMIALVTACAFSDHLATVAGTRWSQFIYAFHK